MRINRQPPTPPSTTTTTTATTTTASATTATSTDSVDGSGGAFHASRDMRSRVGVNAVQGGSTTTAVPKLLDAWKAALYEAAAEDLAEAEVIAPVLDKALQRAEADKGEGLTRQEVRGLSKDVHKQLKGEYQAARDAHHQDLTKSPSSMKRTERDVLMEQRPRVAQLRDVFSAVAQNLPGARDREIVLWENKGVMVVVDTFAPSPKALVVPKDPMNLPVDAPKGVLDELAYVAAHVSDAFMRGAGSPPAGIWINPPQHLTVSQMHVHVLPDLGQFTQDGAPAKAFLEDPQYKPQLVAWFDVIAKELAQKLGPAI
jgi:diadenosine tetraphosphate (Ap4A) HIT family hydrolase